MAQVLIIDDSRLSVSALQNMIGDMGHQIVGTAFTGEDGVERAKETNPDIVCLDMVMPGIDGKETANKLRQINASVKIVMITQNPIDDSDKSQIQAVSYVVKPITKAKLQEAFTKV